MRVLLTGASGFIGSRLAAALADGGHEVLCAVRDVRSAERRQPRYRYVAADFARDHDAAVWRPRLDGVDLVINAVGILRESREQRFEAIHVRAPQALFAACVAAGVPRVLQLSALGADEQARSRYHLSKRAADTALRALPLSGLIVQPSLVYGPGGSSARLFTGLASLPLIPLPGRGEQRVQPIHVDDLIAALLRLIEQRAAGSRRIALVGPQALSLRALLATLRTALGLGRAHFLPLPLPLVRLGAGLGRLLPASLLDAETLAMLERGNTADASDTARLLGRPPRAVAAFIAPHEMEAARAAALLNWALPLLRLSVALVWIGTAIVSFGLYPASQSYALLARTGLHGALASVALYGAATLDLLLGLATLAPRRPPGLWLAQIALILGYTALITWKLPEYWLHPYGPILKNLPLLAALLLLQAAERAR